MEIQNYVLAENLEQAYELLMKSRRNKILGGCTFLRSTGIKVATAIDLCCCGLDYIREEEDLVRIGAYTSFRDMEISDIIKKNFGNVFEEVLEHLIGVQLRNHITVGGHVFSRYGFSDFIPTLLAMNASVTLYHGGILTLEDYLNGEIKRDILTEIVIPKEGRKAKVKMMRNSYSDYSLLCVAVSARKQSDYRIAVGARPGKAVLLSKIMEGMNQDLKVTEHGEEWAKKAVSEVHFGSNFRASGEYRKELCHIFIRRAIEELGYED